MIDLSLHRTAPSRARLIPAGILAFALLGVAGCAGTTYLEPGTDAANPVCANVVLGVPEKLAGLDQGKTSSQGTVIWGSPEGSGYVALRCGVTDPGPTTDTCSTIKSPTGQSVDWVSTKTPAGTLFTTFGRKPAVDVLVADGAASEQTSAPLVDLSTTIAKLQRTKKCL